MFAFFKDSIKKKSNKLYSVADGRLISLDKVPDDVFSKGLIGNGVAIEMGGDLVASPCYGQITMIFPTLHAFGIKSNDGLEILVHIGIDTVKLSGRGFTQLAKLNSVIKAGDPVIQIDRKTLSNYGYQPIAIVIVTNGNGYNINYYDELEVIKGKTIIASY